MKKVARELGVHFVLEGSLRKADNRVRITGARACRRDRLAVGLSTALVLDAGTEERDPRST